jgi:hypothetical protein
MVAVFLALWVEATASRRRADKRHLLHIEKLERMILAKSTGEYVAGERMVGAVPPADPPPPPKPSLHDDIWRGPSRA